MSTQKAEKKERKIKPIVDAGKVQIYDITKEVEALTSKDVLCPGCSERRFQFVVKNDEMEEVRCLQCLPELLTKFHKWHEESVENYKKVIGKWNAIAHKFVKNPLDIEEDA